MSLGDVFRKVQTCFSDPLPYGLVREESGNDEEAETISVNEDVERNGVSSFCAFWNVCNSIQGVAILAMPYVIKCGGWWSVVAIFLVASLSNYTGQILIRCHYEEVNDCESRKKALVRVRHSYAEIGASLWPKYGRSVVLIIQVLELLFMSTLYPIVATSVLKILLPQVSISSTLWILLFGIVVVPNAFLSRLHHISAVSTVTVVSAGFILVAVCLYCATQSHSWGLLLRDRIDLHEFVTAVGIIVASYSSQMYLAVIESDMKKPSHFSNVMNAGYTAMTIFKIVIGVAGYVTFGPDTQQVVTLNLPSGVMLTSINVVVIIMSVTSYTLPMFTVFEILEKEVTALTEKNDVIFKVGSTKVKFRRVLVRLGFRLSLIAVTLLMAASVPHFCLVLGFIGSFTGALLEFTLPIAFFTVLKGTEHRRCLLVFNMAVLMSCVFFMVGAIYFSGVALIDAFQQRSREIWSIK